MAPSGWLKFSFGSGGPPAPLPAGFVEQLKGMTGAEGELGFREDLVAGDRVRVVGGPFDELCGTLEKASDGKRVTILLELLSKQTRVRLSRELLIAA